MSDIIGYARTSTSDQVAGLDAQIRDLKAAGCSRVFSEHISSMADIRPELVRCLEELGPGDVLMVAKPDRLARSTRQLLDVEESLSKREIGLVVLSMGGARLDTRNPTSKLMLTILAAVAAWEREIMLERQREGIAKAKADKKYKGRPRIGVRLPDRVDSVLRDAAAGIFQRDIAEKHGISPSTVSRIVTPQKPACAKVMRPIPNSRGLNNCVAAA